MNIRPISKMATVAERVKLQRSEESLCEGSIEGTLTMAHAVIKYDGGYECDFVEQPPKALTTECPICLQILRKPHLITCCCRKFCQPCIELATKESRPCPFCNETDFALVHEKELERTLKQFYVSCKHKKNGCPWVGELGDFEKHLNVNPKPDDQLTGCEFVEVSCTYNCDKSLQRQLMNKHQSSDCRKRPFSCEYCHDYKSTFEDVAYYHWPQCKCYPLSCPNLCDRPYAIERQNLPEHLNECPLQVISCDFSYVGCETQLPRKDMPLHLTDNFKHISLLAMELVDKNKEIIRLTEESRAELCELRRENELLRVEVACLKEQSCSLHSHTGLVPFEFTMTDFNYHKWNNTEWYSPSFYTHPHKYKMCLRVDANGSGDGKRFYVSVLVHLMRGEFDDHLRWPFQGDVTIELLNQLEDNDHYAMTIRFSGISDAICGRVLYRERASTGWGCSRFIPHTDLDITRTSNRRCQYLKANTLCFRVSSVVLKSFKVERTRSVMS